jgi:hypothetical protein
VRENWYRHCVYGTGVIPRYGLLQPVVVLLSRFMSLYLSFVRVYGMAENRKQPFVSLSKFIYFHQIGNIISHFYSNNDVIQVKYCKENYS